MDKIEDFVARTEPVQFTPHCYCPRCTEHRMLMYFKKTVDSPLVLICEFCGGKWKPPGPIQLEVIE